MSTVSGISSTANPYLTSQAANQNGSNPFLQNLNALGSALQSGSVSSAQSALSTLQQSLPGNSQASSSQPFGSNSQANTDYSTLVSDVQSGNVSGAQSAFASLKTDLKSGHAGGHHHHHGGGTPPSATSSETATASSTSGSTAGSLLNVTV